MRGIRWALAAICLSATARAAEQPEVGFVLARPEPEFPCDISKLTLPEYNACYATYLADLCGTQLLERDRFEMEPVGRTLARGGASRVIASAYPYSLHLDRGAVYAQEASAEDVWRDPRLVLRDQSPQLGSIDSFVATRTSFVLADRTARRVFVLPKSADGRRPSFRKVELADRSMTFVGVLSNRRFVAATSREMLLLGVDGRDGIRLKIPLDEYSLDREVDQAGHILLTSKTPGGNVYLLNSSGDVEGAFPRDPKFSYHLLPMGVIAAADLSSGTVVLQSPTGVVLARTKLGRTLSQFGVLRHRKGADLFYVVPDGIGLLYPDGLEKSFMTRSTAGLRVLEANNGILGVVSSTPSRDDPRIWVDRTVEYFALGKARNKVSKVVEGVCPTAIRLAEQAVKLGPALKASMVNGRFSRR